MASKHFCDFGIEHEAIQCPRLGIYNETARPETGSGPWYCGFHRLLENRKKDYQGKAILQAMIDDVVSGKMPRGTTFHGKETDAMVDAEVDRLQLIRESGESKIDFINRCKSKMKLQGAAVLLTETVHEAQIQALLAAGENPFIDNED